MMKTKGTDNTLRTKKVPRSWFGKIWHFLWYDDSFLSWLCLLILSFVLIKFVVYPGLGLVLGTQFPIVAVVSESMDHQLTNGAICGEHPLSYDGGFNNYWQICGKWYENRQISKEQFSAFSLAKGFSKGDIIVLRGKDPKDINIGDVIVFRAQNVARKPDPIIHRVVLKNERGEGIDPRYFFQTKGDHNPGIHQDTIIQEEDIDESRILGVAWFKIPWLGHVKIFAVELLQRAGL